MGTFQDSIRNAGALAPRAARLRVATHGQVCFGALLSLSLLGACGSDTTTLVHAPSGGGLQLVAGPVGSSQTLGQMGVDTAQLGSTGTPVFLSGRIEASVRNAATASAMVLQQLGRAYRLAPGTQFATLADEADETGRRYIKLQQLHQGIPVLGRELVVQAEADGSVAAVLGELAPELTLVVADDVAKAISGADAVKAAMTRLGSRGTVRVHQEPALRIFQTAETGSAQLAYRTLVEYADATGFQLDVLTLRASDGAVLERTTQVHEALNRNIYDLGGACLGLGGTPPGTLKRAEGAAATADASVNNIYDHLGTTFHFYKNFFGRESYDAKGAELKATAHVKFFTGSGCSGANAAWLGTPYFQMVYGDGDGMVLKDLSLAIDVTAHEVTHAVTNLSSNLTYRNESGALNEGMSDIFGSGAEAWLASGGSAAGNPATVTHTADTWLLGKEVAGPKLTGGALRYMDNPTLDMQSKDYFPERYVGTGDNGGVHLNSGIPNLVHVLITQGGKHPRGKTNIDVKGIGLEKSLRIFFLANTKLFTTTTTFEAARYATAQAAENLYGRCSQEWMTVQSAWDAVGVNGQWSLCVRPKPKF